MRLLILGGTVFLGKHVVERALGRGHEVTLFNRGQSHPDRFPDVEKLAGDRDGGLDPLRGREWDAVVDTSGYLPRIVSASAELLADAVDRYLFVSTVSVYDAVGLTAVNEQTPVATIEDPTVEEIDGEKYGPLKALCEQVVQRALPGRSMVVRPGLIVGPDDTTDRFTYWPVRMADGGDVLCPEPRDQPSQVIDVRDLAAWIVTLLENRATGVLNGVGPGSPTTLGSTIETCAQVVGSSPALHWADGQFLIDQGVEPWSDLPLWLGPDTAEHWLDLTDPGPAVAAGLTYRPIEETIADTLAWHRATADTGRWGFPMSLQREAALLSIWRAQGR
jgi:2'-hydroxyisoflavone reductase